MAAANSLIRAIRCTTWWQLIRLSAQLVVLRGSG